MVARLSQCIYGNKAATVASSAIAGGQGALGAGMTHRGGRKGCCIFMASIALRGGWDMTAGLGLDANGDAMARIASTGYRRDGGGMVKDRSGKGRGALVADIALRRGRDMVSGFVLGAGADAMAGGAIARGQGPPGAAMVHCGWDKGGGVFMAGIALRRGLDVPAGLSPCPDGAAMAGIATAGDRRIGRSMVEFRAHKGGG